MNIGTSVYNLLLMPLELIFDFVFSVLLRVFSSPVFSLIGLSLVVNILCLPLYRRADAIQMAENEKRASMENWVKHIRNTFKGDERYMMLNTYYRQQGYKPVYALKSSISLLLQIPFFMVAYRYLSSQELLKGASFWIFRDLGAPDQLLSTGNFAINIMPVIMTLLNVASAYIYLKGMPLSQKIQTYALAAVFLVLLYNSPSGLVIYWTCNQIFSLLKNVFMKRVKDGRVLAYLVSAAGFIILVFMLVTGRINSAKRIVIVIALLVICQIPLVLYYRRNRQKGAQKEKKPVRYRVFLMVEIYLSVFMGAVIPLSVVRSSPWDFYGFYNTAVTIVINNFLIYAGFFLIWFNIFYYLAGPSGRRIFTYVMLAFSGVTTLDFFLFGKNLGRLSAFLVFDNEPVYSVSNMIINLAAAAAVAAGLCLLLKLLGSGMFFVYAVAVVCVLGIVITDMSGVINTMSYFGVSLRGATDDIEPVFRLSKTGKNVVFFMLDKAISPYLPFIFNEKSQLYEQFEGFTYYPNTVSFGTSTNLAGPGVFGGYEYSVEELNKRSDELMADKHNEAIKVLPALFSQNGYNVIVADIPYGNYQIPSDLSIYDDLDNTTTYHLDGTYSSQAIGTYGQYISSFLSRNFFYYSIFKGVPEIFQRAVYDDGQYYSGFSWLYVSELFLDAYSVLCLMPELTEAVDDENGTFVFMANNSAHENTILSRDDYMPMSYTKTESMLTFQDGDYEEWNGIHMLMDTWKRVSSYDVNAGSLLRIGEWLDYLKENDLYDNTRIIIVADHGWNVNQFDYLIFGEGDPESEAFLDVERVNPLLLFKDFDSRGDLEINWDFMVNADAPALAAGGGLIEDPVNPYTGRNLLENNKSSGVNITLSNNWDIDENNGYVIETSDNTWYHISENIYEKDNWIPIEGGSNAE